MMNQHWLGEHHVFASTVEDVHAKYEGLYANICDISGKLHVNGNMFASFWNQKVLDTALESWALALQESTNKNAVAVKFEELNKIENEAMLWMPFNWYHVCHSMTCQAFSATQAKSKHFKTKIKTCKCGMRSYPQLVPYFCFEFICFSWKSFFCIHFGTYVCQAYGW